MRKLYAQGNELMFRRQFEFKSHTKPIGINRLLQSAI